MYLLQPPLFSFEQILELQPKNRLQAVFSTLNLEPVLQLLKPESKFGPKGYPREAMLRSLIAKQLEAIPNIAKLVERLRTDPSFRYHCGFNAFGTVPSEATFSRFIAKLEKTGAIELLFEQTVAQGRADGIVGNEYVALDSTEIKAWEKPQPKGKPTSDQEAAWGSKRDTSGNQKAWFGYKTHIACDCKSELPIAIVVTPANVHDSKVALPLMKKVTSSLPPRQVAPVIGLWIWLTIPKRFMQKLSIGMVLKPLFLLTGVVPKNPRRVLTMMALLYAPWDTAWPIGGVMILAPIPTSFAAPMYCAK